MVGEVEIPLEHLNLVRLLITSSTLQNVPVGEIILADTHGIFKQLVTLSDSTPIIITVGNAPMSTRTYSFRAFRHTESPSGSGVTYKIPLYFDNAMYWHGTTTKAFKGTSSKAIEYIAANCSLESACDDTADSMVWLPMNDKWGTFARRIANAGYFDDTSGFMFGMHMDGTVVYKNVAAYKYTEQLPLFSSAARPTANVLPVVSHKPLTTSGYNNFSGAYHQSHVAHDITAATDEGERHDKVTKIRATQDLGMNADVKGQLGGRAVTIAPVDCGNTHESYQKGIYQNTRLRKLNSNHLAVLTNVVSRLDLLDQVRVEIYDTASNGEPKLNFNSSGYYFVRDKTVYVGPEAIYCERFTLSRDGHNTDPSNSQKDV